MRSGEDGRKFPGLKRSREFADWTLRNHGKSGLGFGADAGGPLVADLTAGTGRGTCEGRNRRRMVVSFNLDQDIHGLTCATDIVAKQDRGKIAAR